MARLSDFSQGIMITILVVYVIVFTYAFIQDSKHEKELDNDDSYDEKPLNRLNRRDIEVMVGDILSKKEKEKSLFKKLMNSGRNGAIVGGLSGTITGGPASGIAMAVVFGLINPIIIVVNEFTTIPEDLKIAKHNHEKENLKKILGYYSHLPIKQK